MKQSDYDKLEDELYSDPHAWRDYALCLDATEEDQQILFPWGKEPPPEEDTEAYLEGHCYQCPVRQKCLDLALKTESIGVFGGFVLTPSKVARLQRLRRSKGRVTVESAEELLGGNPCSESP